MKTNFRWQLYILPLIMLAIAAFSYPRLPEEIPVHFNFSGEADRYGSRATIFYLALIALAIPLLNEVLSRVDPKRKNYSKFRRESSAILFFVNLLLLAVQLLTIFFALGYPLNISRITPILVGILLAVCGNFMPRFRQNYHWGIKTPWTLASEEVWVKTHRMGGRLMYLGGFLMILTAFLPSGWNFGCFTLVIALMVLAPAVYSYLLYRKTESAE